MTDTHGTIGASICKPLIVPRASWPTNSSNTFQPLIGPEDRRVLLRTNIRLASESQSIQEAVFTMNRYTEQLTWRDAATGRILAESDFFEPLIINSLTTPGFGGRVYFPTAVGKGFYVLQVMPKAKPQGHAEE